MMRWAAGTSAIAGFSFLLGKYTNKEELPFIRNAHSATNVALQKIEMPTTLNENAMGPSRCTEIMKHGYPGFDHVRTFEDYVLSYDRKTKTAHWVCEHLSPERLVRGKEVDRAKCEFRPDESIHKYFQSQNEDYRGSGFDRGHLAAAGNHRKSQLAVDQTFFLTNMSPQVGRGFNRDKWNELEMHCRKKAKHTLNTYIVTGPLYLPKMFEDGKKYVKYQVIGNNNVAVPTHFFKAALFEIAPNQYELECYLLANEIHADSTPLSTYHVPLDALERQAGLRIFERVPEKSIVKINGAAKRMSLW